MTTLKLNRDHVTIGRLPTEDMPAPTLGGTVTVRGLRLSERLQNDAIHVAERQPRDGETEAQARARAGSQIVARVLAQTVIDDEGKPLLTAAEWDEHGASNQAEVLTLFNKAMELSGERLEVAAKN